ncbi:MAG: YARHG domain-containing protein [Myxococcota bacterium]
MLAGRTIETALAEYDAEPGQTVDDLLAGLSPLTLVRLRNAPYARHGRAFNSRDLQSFFYDDPPPLMKSHFSLAMQDRQRSGVFPQTVDPSYADAKLTKVDHANVGVIREVERRLAERG